jgi:hypothetical protein
MRCEEKFILSKQYKQSYVYHGFGDVNKLPSIHLGIILFERYSNTTIFVQKYVTWSLSIWNKRQKVAKC